MRARPSTTRRLVTGIAVCAAAVLALAGCAGSAGGGASAGATTEKIRVGVLPIIDVAPLYLGVEEGIFAAEGLDVELVSAQSGAAIIPAAVSGDFSFGVANLASLMLARSKGLPISLVTTSSLTSGTPGADSAATVTMPDSGITGIADLIDRSVAVTSLGGAFTLTLRHLAVEAGLDPARINFVELPAADTPAALERGQVDAAVVSEPFLTLSLDAGATPVIWNYPAVYENFMIGAYFTTEQYAASHPETVAAFARGLDKSFVLAESDHTKARDALGLYTEIAPEVRARVNLPRWSAPIDRGSIDILNKMLVEDGQIDEPVDPSSLGG